MICSTLTGSTISNCVFQRNAGSRPSFSPVPESLLRPLIFALCVNRKGSIALILREESNTLLSLTEQETTVLRWMNYGKTDPEIAAFEEMKLGTVKKYVKRILDALGTDKRAAAAAEYERLMSGRAE